MSIPTNTFPDFRQLSPSGDFVQNAKHLLRGDQDNMLSVLHLQIDSLAHNTQIGQTAADAEQFTAHLQGAFFRTLTHLCDCINTHRTGHRLSCFAVLKLRFVVTGTAGVLFAFFANAAGRLLLVIDT